MISLEVYPWQKIHPFRCEPGNLRGILRNHGPQGKFTEVEDDLERIQALGVDVIWFMPIHPIGQLNKKARWLPLSISDYREVNPEYGTKADFARLIEKAHRLGMKVMIDVGITTPRMILCWSKTHPIGIIRTRLPPVTTVLIGVMSLTPSIPTLV